jgi:hypothetical protein
MPPKNVKPIELELNKFDPRILEKKRLTGHSPTILYCGKKDVGKSTLVADILWYIRKIPAVVCMSGTEDGSGFYGKYIHELCLYNKFEKDVLATVVEKQKQKIKELKEKGIDPKERPDTGICLIFDDLSFDNGKDSIMKNPHVREIFFNGRHYNITTFITCQYMMDMSPSLRTNIDYAFICKETKNDNIKRLYDYFFSVFDKISDFKKVLSSCTNDFNCLVIDNTSRSDKLEDQVFWYKADPNRQFRISPDKWDLWDKMLNKDSSTKEKKFGNGNDLIVVKKKGIKRRESDDEYEDDYDE